MNVPLNEALPPDAPPELLSVIRHIELMESGDWKEPSWLSQAEAVALKRWIEELVAKRDAPRLVVPRRVYDYSGMGF